MNIKLKNSTRTFTIDDKHYDMVSLYGWSVVGGKYEAITMSSWPYHMIANYIMNDYKNKYDHKDRDPFNNIEANLRIASSSQNGANRDKPDTFKPSSSEYKGVCWCKRDKRWRASIKVNYKLINLGSFRKETDAAEAYNKAALEYFGEFAQLNVIKKE